MKIITLTPNQVDATSFYRAWGVFPDIMKRSDITFTDYYDAQMMLGEANEALLGQTLYNTMRLSFNVHLAT